jgi:hypothetical protein
MRFRQWILGGLLAGVAIAGASSVARADAYLPGATFAIACENGGNYRLSSMSAVAIPGDIVTARLYLSPHRAVPVRLIPMGEGYRYAGRGIWLDGIREHALLYLSKYHPVPCFVSRV